MSRSSTFWMALLMRRTSAGSPAAAMLRSRMDALQPTSVPCNQLVNGCVQLTEPCIIGRVRQDVLTQEVSANRACCPVPTVRAVCEHVSSAAGSRACQAWRGLWVSKQHGDAGLVGEEPLQERQTVRR